MAEPRAPMGEHFEEQLGAFATAAPSQASGSRSPPFRHFVSLAFAMTGRAHRVAKREMTTSKGGSTLGRQEAGSHRGRRLQAFHPSYRRFVAELTACSSELEDLADSFP